MAHPLELYSSLESQLQKLERRFVRPHLPLPPTSNPSDYDLDVRAYCVLCHAAFEQYIEDLCLQLMIDAVDCWIETRFTTNTLLALLAFAPEIEPDLKESNPERSFFDYIRSAANERKGSFSRFLWNNNGVSSQHLRQMLLPVGLNVPDNARWLGSLKQLAKQRGEQAHRGHVKTVPSPEAAVEWVDDCLEMCGHIRNKAIMA
jgi:RiboL-PSP-HEPN